MSGFKKNLCKTCNIDDDCCCQRESQASVYKCGMDEVVEFNARINTRGQNYNNPDYGDFMNERY